MPCCRRALSRASPISSSSQGRCGRTRSIQRDACAETPPDRADLDAGGAAADDGKMAGSFFERQRVGVIENAAMIEIGGRERDRLGTGGDHDVMRGEV